MNRKVNIKNASTAWLWLMIIPFANGFILTGKASSIFEKKYKIISLLLGILSILLFIAAFILPIYVTYILIKNNPDMTNDIVLNKALLSMKIMLYAFLASYLGIIITAFVMKHAYAYKRGVINYANENNLSFNNFETAENEVENLINKNYYKQNT